MRNNEIIRRREYAKMKKKKKKKKKMWRRSDEDVGGVPLHPLASLQRDAAKVIKEGCSRARWPLLL